MTINRAPAVLLCAIFFLSFGLLPKTITVAVQPLGDIDPSSIDLVRSALSETFGIRSATKLAALPLPKSAFYEPGRRYRAERLLVYLDKIRAGRFTKIVGLTSVDISTTKGSYEDWGIFGMATVGGPACVVSTYRLGKAEGDRDLFMSRVRKVITHEIGHILGLPHCQTPGCVMRDAAGSIKTFDESDGKLCRKCKRILGIADEDAGKGLIE
jgi:archaemetzincin